MESLDTCAYKWHKCAWQQVDYNVTIAASWIRGLNVHSYFTLKNTNTPKVTNDVEEQFSSPSLNLWDLMGCSHHCKFTFSLVLPVWIHLRWKHLHSHHYQANITMRSKANCWITPFNMTRFSPKFLQLSMKPIFRHHSEGSYKESIQLKMSLEKTTEYGNDLAKLHTD